MHDQQNIKKLILNCLFFLLLISNFSLHFYQNVFFYQFCRQWTFQAPSKRISIKTFNVNSLKLKQRVRKP